MQSLSTLVPDDDRELVQATAAALVKNGNPGAAGEPEALLQRLCFLVAAMAPQLPIARLSTLVAYARWTIRLDDLLDRRDADPTEVSKLAAEVAAVTNGDRPGRNPLVMELAHLRDQLADFSRDRELIALFGAALRDAVGAGITHARLGRAVAAGRQPAPTAEEYLTVAARTVNYHSFTYALLATTGVATGGGVLAGVTAALQPASQAIRLSNDLRSLARDRAEAMLNILFLRSTSGAVVTPQRVAEWIDRLVRSHDTLLAQLPEPDPDLAAELSPRDLLDRGLRLSIGMYRLTDLR